MRAHNTTALPLIDPLHGVVVCDHLVRLRLRRSFGRWKARLYERQVEGVADTQCTFMMRLKCFERWKHRRQDKRLAQLSPTKSTR